MMYVPVPQKLFFSEKSPAQKDFVCNVGLV